MEATTTTRTTQTATTPDGILHIFTVSNGRTRCPATEGLTRTGRRPLTDITCNCCRAAYPALAAAPELDRVDVEPYRGEGAPGWTVTPVWKGVDRPVTHSWCVGTRKLADRLAAAVEAGVVYDSPTILTDINQDTYVGGRSRVMAKYANADLTRLGF